MSQKTGKCGGRVDSRNEDKYGSEPVAGLDNKKNKAMKAFREGAPRREARRVSVASDDVN